MRGSPRPGQRHACSPADSHCRRDGPTAFQPDRVLRYLPITKKYAFQELELVDCWETFAKWCDELHEAFAPFADKYEAHADTEPQVLRKSLFPAPRSGEFGELRDLQSLEVLAAQLHGANTLVLQVAQGLRDRQLLETSLQAEDQIRRMQAWTANQVKHRAVHSVLVPM